MGWFSSTISKNNRYQTMSLKKIIGFLTLIVTWFYTVNPAIHGILIFPQSNDYTIKGTVMLLFLGLSYCLFNDKDYPNKFILTAIISNFIAYKLADQYDSDSGEVIYTINLYVCRNHISSYWCLWS